jgi:hypothetical protein
LCRPRSLKQAEYIIDVTSQCAYGIEVTSVYYLKSINEQDYAHCSNLEASVLDSFLDSTSRAYDINYCTEKLLTAGGSSVLYPGDVATSTKATPGDVYIRAVYAADPAMEIPLTGLEAVARSADALTCDYDCITWYKVRGQDD